MKEGLFLNGVFEGVLEEILSSIDNSSEKVFYLQPYSEKYITLLKDTNLSMMNRIPMYISTTKNLRNISYIAEIVGWEDKNKISKIRLEKLNEFIQKYQPGENEIYLKNKNGRPCTNLISIINLCKLDNQLSVSNLTKLSDNLPLKPRTQAGGFSYVKPLLINHQPIETYQKDVYDERLQQETIDSKKLDHNTRLERLKHANRKPEIIEIITRGYKRNPDVIVEVLHRANGKCEHCGRSAPFMRSSDNTPYLEVQHMKSLSEDGEDTIENAIAVCPNCHKEFHFGKKT